MSKEPVTYVRKPEEVEAMEIRDDNTRELVDFGVHIPSLEWVTKGSVVAKDDRGVYTIYTREEFDKLFQRKLIWDENI